MSIISNVQRGFDYIFDDLGDPRVKDWWLMKSPWPVLTVLGAYLYFCSYKGPQYMKDKKPYRLKNVLIVYNIVQIALSVYLTYTGLVYIYKTSYRFTCQDINYSNDPENLRWASSVYLYFIAKITELLDTVFFVLRKKQNQVTFLHLYHHTLMPLLSWYGTKYYAGGQAIPEGTVNSFIHVIMYGYYLVAGLGPQYQKYLWWKKHLTSMQLIQFCLVLYLNVVGLFSQNCNYPKSLNVIVVTNCLAFLYMFGRFYYNSYVKNNRGKSEVEIKES
ncbi:elongation of very long chain fatty acids protein 7 isoform X1 [Bombyx mori]|uniref:Elongation of very long chain fatty acids protein n=2 Tax=Bombyx mori TaxID=7091 RepID=A0A8R1WFW5_BOMMO|nr:elongation of very long chain fatty acids protein 7 [Bombyx mori]